ncbi:response regulator [Vannielia litorea]|uniref:CheY chemotaxis protein or a CheY-like REC (Receiver) domain n=1 Tax=Vannielia litorea TaxID=1217970 RepID=A0A1N6HEK8_9RHOB|nr:response regulator [Vannielia litorea]SIO18147.1 CheY chemotaxis protein or a CheY-like REC (receiver) domain [Vannielia litorea]
MNAHVPTPTAQNVLNIILIEDDDGDAKAVLRALSQSRIANPVHRMRDGIEALAFLRGEGATRPPEHYVVLLDINMPRMNGHEFMAELRNDPRLNRAVVFMLSTSRDETDIARAYDKNVAGYVLKGNAGMDFLRLINGVEHFWRIVVLPDMTQPGQPRGG